MISGTEAIVSTSEVRAKSIGTILLLDLLPFLTVNPCLPQNPGKKVSADIALMGIGDSKPELPFDHILVLATHVRAFEIQAFSDSGPSRIA